MAATPTPTAPIGCTSAGTPPLLILVDTTDKIDAHPAKIKPIDQSAFCIS